MRIVVNAALLPEIYSREYISFLSEAFRRITKNHPEETFIFICENQDAHLFVYENKAEIIKVRARKRNFILWKYWYDIRIPALLKKYKADLFFSPGLFGSLNTNLPQCLIATGVDFSSPPLFFTKSQLLFFKRRTQKSIATAKKIITFSAFAKTDLNKRFKNAENKTTAIPLIIPENNESPTDLLKNEIKIKYTAGKEFFLYAGSIHPSGNLITLLKAFSLFKKRQQSNLKLIICGNGLNSYKTFSRLLETYKYKADIIVINHCSHDELSKLMLSAYAFVYPVLSNSLFTSVLQAMQSELPVIVSDNPMLNEMVKDSALYVKPENPQDIAEGMMRIYKDEKLRTELIEKGKVVLNHLRQQDAAEQLWKVMQEGLL
ncbi:MAG: glycosyltransferase family 1 protein [Bacteroidota bacterium]